MANETHLKELNPKVEAQFRAFIKDIEAMGFKVIITDAYRTIKRSAELYKLNSKNAKPGYSSHNYGTALDLNVIKNGKQYMKATSLKEWIATGIPKLAKEKYGMRWGGDFSGYKDPIHFDYNNKYNTVKLYELAVKQFGTIEKAVGNRVIIP